MTYPSITPLLEQGKIIRRWMRFFILSLVLSGLTAFALETELHWLINVWPAGILTGVYDWIAKVHRALEDSNTRYPFLAYGYDWLAFGHLVIALFFVGPLRHPIENKWVLSVGMLACVLVLPLAFIAGAVRGIPLYWRLIDCSFGVIGIVPLAICYRKIGLLERAIRDHERVAVT